MSEPERKSCVLQAQMRMRSSDDDDDDKSEHILIALNLNVKICLNLQAFYHCAMQLLANCFNRLI